MYDWKFRSLALASLLLAGGMAAGHADSLYTPGKSRNMFSDRRARQVGDIVTVLITESTTAVQDANLQTNRKLEASASGGTGGPFQVLKLVPKATLGGSMASTGSGSTTRNSKVTSTITCTVTEITPAGQLVLKGERHLAINKDTQIIRFSGIARPDDIEPDNSVLSGSVAEAQIEIQGKGPINHNVTPSLLSRIFHFLF